MKIKKIIYHTSIFIISTVLGTFCGIKLGEKVCAFLLKNTLDAVLMNCSNVQMFFDKISGK